MLEKFLIDTGPFLDLIVRQYETVFPHRWPDRKHQYQALLTQLDGEDFLKFLQTSRGRVATTSGVMTEMGRHLQRAEEGVKQGPARPEFRGRYWSLVCAACRDLQLAESTVPVVEMDDGELRTLGPADAGLLEIARREAKGGAHIIVLTSDSRLLERCKRHELAAEYVVERLEKFRGIA